MGALSDYSENHIIPLDFGSVHTVPESHVWSESDDEYRRRRHSGSTESFIYVPVIDLGDPKAPERITEACEKWGIFQLTGHGISTENMEKVEVEAERLFSLSLDRKLKALRSPSGGPGYGRAIISPFFPKKMWHEGFTIMGPSATDHAKRLWPHGFQGFCETMDDYQQKMKALIEQLIYIIFNTLNIDPQQLTWLKDGGHSGHQNTPGTALQLNSYPPCPDPTRAMGLAQHTDTSLITILQAQTSGLQIFRDNVGWVSVQPLQGALTVNTGDFLHIVSNGRFLSVLHRVLVNPVQRFSLAYFYAPPPGFVVSPLLSKASSDSAEVARYRSVTTREFIAMKTKHLDRAITMIKI